MHNVKPPLRKLTGGWSACIGCRQVISDEEVRVSWMSCPHCGKPVVLTPEEWVEFLVDEGSFCEQDRDLESVDPLQFVDKVSYRARYKASREKTNSNSAVMTGYGRVDGVLSALIFFDFRFMGGSLGIVEGEKIARIIEWARDNRSPVFSMIASGGARMQESFLALMQMAVVMSALEMHRAERLAHIVLLSHPATGGTFASLGSYGTVILGETQAQVTFTGRRVAKQVLSDAEVGEIQTAEHLLAHGLLDGVVSRKELKEKIAFFLHFFS